MIARDKALKIQRGLPREWTSAVQEIVENKGIRNNRGTIYTRGYISMIAQGERHVPEIEEVILDVYAENVKQIMKDAMELGIINEAV